jgi:hypothetical protein
MGVGRNVCATSWRKADQRSNSIRQGRKRRSLAHRHSAKRHAAVADAIAKGKENMLLWPFVAGA